MLSEVTVPQTQQTDNFIPQRIETIGNNTIIILPIYFIYLLVKIFPKILAQVYQIVDEILIFKFLELMNPDFGSNQGQDEEFFSVFR